MTWWDFTYKYGRDDAEVRRAAAFADAFTPKELDRLQTLRDRAASAYASIELGLDERRLRFARWLAEHGRIGEGVEAVTAEARTDAGAAQDTQPALPSVPAATR